MQNLIYFKQNTVHNFFYIKTEIHEIRFDLFHNDQTFLNEKQVILTFKSVNRTP